MANGEAKFSFTGTVSLMTLITLGGAIWGLSRYTNNQAHFNQQIDKRVVVVEERLNPSQGWSRAAMERWAEETKRLNRETKWTPGEVKYYGP